MSQFISLKSLPRALSLPSSFPRLSVCCLARNPILYPPELSSPKQRPAVVLLPVALLPSSSATRSRTFPRLPASTASRRLVDPSPGPCDFGLHLVPTALLAAARRCDKPQLTSPAHIPYGILPTYLRHDGKQTVLSSSLASGCNLSSPPPGLARWACRLCDIAPLSPINSCHSHISQPYQIHGQI